MDFVNRRVELDALTRERAHGGLVVVFGRRRVGKTRLLGEWLKKEGGLYTQAIEAGRELQLAQTWADVRHGFQSTIEPRSWSDFFELVDLQPKPPTLCIDEFPYLVAADPSLPSIVQRFLDHRKHKSLLILAGSSTRMMNDALLDRSAPLYGRARKIIQVDPMSYGAFSAAKHLAPSQSDTFTRFALVGGVPRYWELVSRTESPIQLAEALFFGTSPLLEFEPSRLLKDEGISGLTALAVLEAIGRGAEKASEIAGRLGTVQTNLSRLFQLLLDAGILARELPFGESLRTTKRTLYRIVDPTLRFWFRVYSPHRTRWITHPPALQEKLLRDHAATVFEDVVRASTPGAARYWEGDVEIDSVRTKGDRLVVTEVKWTKLTKAARAAVEQDLRARFSRTQLSKKASRFSRVDFEVADSSALVNLAKAK
ncbi:ATP-binding protein [soil metagenome]